MGNNGNVVTLHCTRHATVSTTYIITHNLRDFFCFDDFSSLVRCWGGLNDVEAEGPLPFIGGGGGGGGGWCWGGKKDVGGGAP